MIIAFIIWLGWQIPLAILVGKLLKVRTEAGLIADGMKAISIDDREMAPTSTSGWSLLKAA